MNFKFRTKYFLSRFHITSKNKPYINSSKNKWRDFLDKKFHYLCVRYEYPIYPISLAMDDSEGDLNLQGLLAGVLLGSHSN